MKKLVTVLTLIVLSAGLMASEPINLTKKETVVETEHFDTEFKKSNSVTYAEKQWVEKGFLGFARTYEKMPDGTYRESLNGSYVKIQEHDVTSTSVISTPTHDYKNANGITGLTYTITKTQEYGNGQPDAEGVNYQRHRAQTYFTTTTNIPEGKVLAVQFLGAEIEDGNASYEQKRVWNGWYYEYVDDLTKPLNGYDPNFKVQDYGIYLYDPETGEKGEWLSVKDNNNYFGESVGITAGTSFGIYFVDKDGNYITTTDNVVGNFDDDSHELKTYDQEGNVVPKTTEKHFLCLFTNTFESGKLNQTHWEFMLQTTLDNPYFPVNPNDFGTEVHIDNPVVNGASGQPLPGALVTMVIGGLCATSLRKKKKS